MGIYDSTKPLSIYYADVDKLPNGEISTRNVSGTDTSKDWFGAVDSAEHFYDSFTETDPPTMCNYLADVDIATSTNAYLRDSDGDHAPDGTFFVPFAGSYKKYKGEDRNNNGKNTEVFGSVQETDSNDPESYPSDCFEDLDYDDLWDIIELEIGTDPEKRDTDNDGLSDGEEYYGAYYGTIYSEIHEQTELRFKTDPLNPDTDFDGLPDGLEMGRIDGIPPYNNKSGTYTDLGFAYKQSGYSYDSPTYQTVLNALTQEEKEQYTFEFKDKDEVTRLYPCFIPDDDQNDIRTRTNPLVSDSNTDGEIDGFQDKNKNGTYNPESGESDAVMGFYGVKEAGNPLGLFDGNLFIAKATEDLELSFLDYKSLIFNKGSLSCNNVKFELSDLSSIRIEPIDLNLSSCNQEEVLVLTSLNADEAYNIMLNCIDPTSNHILSQATIGKGKYLILPITGIAKINRVLRFDGVKILSPRELLFSDKDLVGDSKENWNGMLHKILGNAYEIATTWNWSESSVNYSKPTVNSIWCRFGIIFTTNIDNMYDGHFPEIQEYTFDRVPRPFAKEGILYLHDEYTYFIDNSIDISNDWGCIQDKINEMWGKDYQGNWITKYCKGINLVYVPGFAKIKNNQPFGVYATTICIPDKFNLVDAVYLHNYTFTCYRWKAFEQQLNKIINIDEKYFTLPPKTIDEDYYKRDYPFSACVLSHEFGHYLIDDSHNETNNNLMNDKDITDYESVSEGRSDLFKLEPDQINKSRERAKWIKNHIGQ